MNRYPSNLAPLPLAGSPPRPPLPPSFLSLLLASPPRKRPTGHGSNGGRRQRRPGILGAAILLMLAFIMLAMDSCTKIPVSTDEIAHLTMSLGASSRAFAPLAAEMAKYRIAALGPDGLSMDSESTATVLSLDLVPGEWTITAEGLARDDRRLVSGSVVVRLAPGERQSATIVLLPEGGAGSLVLTWSSKGDPGSTVQLEGSLSSTNSSPIALAASGASGSLEFADVPSGSWKLEARLVRDGVKLAGLADSILIVSACETSAILVFEPPLARLALTFVGPSFKAETAELEPPVRRVALGAEAIFECSASLGSGAWFRDGSPAASSSSRFQASATVEGTQRIDWVSDSPFVARSGRSQLIVGASTAFGPYSWDETIVRADLGTAAPARGLDGCRDLAYADNGQWLFAVGKDGSSVTAFALAEGRAPTARSSCGKTEFPALDGASRCALVPGTDTILVLAETAGSLVPIAVGASGELAPQASLSATEFTSGRGLVVSPDARHAWIPSENSDAIVMIDLDANGLPLAVHNAAKSGDPGLESFDRPLCIAISEEGSTLAIGTAGDDAIYLFAVDPVSGALSLVSRISKESVASIASLSDPVDLAFSPSGSSLFVLSYYGKSLIRFDRNGAGILQPVAAAKSGVAPARGFDYPKRLALDPGPARLVIAGGGTTDGLSAFDISSPASLATLGSILPGTGDGFPLRPCALAFAPGGGYLAVSLPDEDCLMLFSSPAAQGGTVSP